MGISEVSYVRSLRTLWSRRTGTVSPLSLRMLRTGFARKENTQRRPHIVKNSPRLKRRGGRSLRTGHRPSTNSVNVCSSHRRLSMLLREETRSTLIWIRQRSRRCRRLFQRNRIGSIACVEIFRNWPRPLTPQSLPHSSPWRRTPSGIWPAIFLTNLNPRLSPLLSHPLKQERVRQLLQEGMPVEAQPQTKIQVHPTMSNNPPVLMERWMWTKPGSHLTFSSPSP